MVVQDDYEFKDYLFLQDEIANGFCQLFGLEISNIKISLEESVNYLDARFPSPTIAFGKKIEDLISLKYEEIIHLINQMNFLIISDKDYAVQKTNLYLKNQKEYLNSIVIPKVKAEFH